MNINACARTNELRVALFCAAQEQSADKPLDSALRNRPSRLFALALSGQIW